MIAKIQALPLNVRVIFFSFMILLAVGAIIGVTLLVLIGIAQNTPRNTPVALTDSVQVEEYAILPDEDSYPASVAITSDGTLYTGSYVSGAIWAIDLNKQVREIPDTREKIGAVSALTVDENDAVYVLDRLTTLDVSGARVWKIDTQDTLTLLVDYTGVNVDILQLPHDIALDNNGNLYLTDRGRTRDHDIIWRIAPDGTGNLWWLAPPVEGARGYEVTGIAFDSENQRMIVTDGFLDRLYAVPIQSDGSAGQEVLLYDARYGGENAPRGFNGVSVGENGRIYLAGLGNNRISAYEPNSGVMTVLAGNYRGASDVVFSPLTQRLFVANWDQRSLLPEVIFLIAVELRPHLPFTIDSIAFVK